MKRYIKSATRIKQVSTEESPKLRQMLDNDYSDSTNISFAGLYQDYKGNQAYKYSMQEDGFDGWICYAVLTDSGYYDLSDSFSDVAVNTGSSLPRMPKTAPANGWPRSKTIKVENPFGDVTEFEAIQSRDGAIKFLYGQLEAIGFPVMRPSWYQGDQQYYEELMYGFDDEPKDPDMHTYFTTHKGVTYVIDDEIDLKKAIEIYYAIPDVESILHGDADISVIFNGAIWRDDDGYWYDTDRESSFESGEAKYGEGNYREV